MMILALVIALALQQVLSPGNPVQSRGWLLSCDHFLERYVAGALPRLILLLLALLLVAEAVFDELGDGSFGLLELLASAAILLWSLGSEDYHTALERLAARSTGPAADDGAPDGAAPDDAGAAEIVASLWMPAEPEHADDGGSARRRLVYAGFARWFPPLFYFALLGPLGALAYRAVAVLTAEGPDDGRLRLLWLLDWVPARLLVLTFALAGDFLAVRERLGDSDAVRAPTPALLAAGAAAARGDGEGVRADGDLLYRCAGIWLVVLSAAILLF